MNSHDAKPDFTRNDFVARRSKGRIVMMRILAVLSFLGLATSAPRAQVVFDSGSDGSDGVLTIADSETLVLNM